MKKSRLIPGLIFFSFSAIFFLGTCSGDDFVEDINVRFCGDGCSSSTPWRVESLDLNLPCFSTKDAFQVLQQKGIKSRFVLFPEENHWILKPQNAMVWQNEFFRWLEETL